MRFSRARYVTLCQQSLVTAAVLAVGVSAAGVKTLDIVPQPGHAVGVRGDVPRALPQQTLTENREEPAKTKVDTAPVTPKVREVKVSGISTAGTGAPTTPTAKPTPSPAPNARLAPKRTQSESQSQSQSGEAGTAEPGKSLVALSDPQPVKGYATVGVTWKHGVDYADDQIDVQVRTEKNGTWSSWMAAEYHDEHGPDGAEGGDAGERPGTDALVIGDVDRVQMRAETTDGSTPPDLKLAVIDPGTGAMVDQAPAIDTAKLRDQGSARTTTSQDAPQALSSPDGEVQDSVALSAMKVAPKPYIYSRAQWGANEKMRDQSAPSYGTIKAGFIHHTVNANNYTADQVPSLLRGIYAYHTQSRGWRDVGYNFLVDRFGRIWEGRWGGVDRPVVGAHTLGYNEVAFAMSAIGNFDTANPPQAVSDAYARLFAWKLSMYNIRADASHIYVKNRYMQAINGHRDVGQTACPGRYLYAKIPAIRIATQRLQNAAQSGTTTTPPKPTPTPTPPPAPAPNPDTFTSPTQTPRPATTQPSGIVFPRSLNLAGDANPELVLKSGAGAVQVFPTGGQTGYRPAVSTPGNWAITNMVAAVGDVTGDGRGDVLARTSKDRVTRVYAGDGAGHFKTSGIAATKAFQWANMLLGAGDWNRDGRNDVLMRDSGTGWLWMFPGRGAGLFGTPTLLSKSWKNIRNTAVVGDVSGDGRPDLAAIHRNGGFYVALSTSTGGITGFQKRGQFGTRFNALLGGARDLTGDAYGDLVVRSAQTGQLSILVGRRGGYFSNVLGPFDGGAGLNQISSGQAAGGAQPDVVGLNKAGTELLVVPHNGLTNLRPALPGNLTRADATQLLNVGDWNRDGRGDLITRQTVGDSLVLRPGLANGQFGNGVVMSRGWKSFTNLTAVGDVTGDKLPDLVGRTKTGKTTIFPGNGATGFKAPVVAPNFLKSYNQVGEGAWKPQYLPGSAYIGSDGAFVPFMGSGAGDLAGYDWVIGPGDVDGDGRNDLVVRDSAGNLWLLPGTATGYATRRLIAAGFGGYTLGG